MRFVAVALIVAGLSAWETAMAERPIPERSPDFQGLHRGFLQREVLDAYSRTGRRDDEWDAGVRELIAGWIDREVASPTAKAAGDLLSLAERATAIGCDDPAVLYIQGRLLHAVGKPYDAAFALRRAHEGFVKSKYAVALHGWAALHLAETVTEAGAERDARPYRQSLLELLPRMATEDGYRENEQRLLFDHLNKRLLAKQPREEAEETWRRLDRAEISPWLRAMLRGVVEFREARAYWEGLTQRERIRTDSPKRGVFKQKMRDVRSNFTTAWEADPTSPEAANWTLLTLMQEGKSLEEMQVWFDRAIDADPGYYVPCRNLSSCMWRRGASPKVMRSVGRKMLATGRFDSAAPYAVIDFSLPPHLYSDLSYPALREEGVYEDLVAMAEGYLSEPTQAASHDWMRSFLVALAWRYQRWDDGAGFLARAPAKLSYEAFDRLGVIRDEAAGEILARTSHLADQVEQADVQTAAGNHAAAGETFAAIVKATEDGRIKDYANRRVFVLDRRARYEAGESVDLLAGEHLRDWWDRTGKWRRGDQGTLLGESTPAGLLLVQKESYGDHYSLEGRVRFVGSKYNGGSEAGVYFGATTNTHVPYFPYRADRQARAFRFNGDRDRVVLSADHRSNEHDVSAALPGTGGTVSFRIERRGETISTYIDDKQMHDNVDLGLAATADEERFAVGGRFWFEGVVIEFLELRIRHAKN